VVPSGNPSNKIVALPVSQLPAKGSILIGLSGGVDSVVLLHYLCQNAARYAWRLSALHVHHGISQNADSWADFCTELCVQYQIPLHIEYVDIAPLREHGTEAAARKLRLAAFAGQSCDFVALAHHVDDQVETLLLQLLRGAGVRGAAAMPQLSDRTDSIPVVRPLLTCSRQEILNYAAEHGLRWINDESNVDDNYPRNFLRHRILPLLSEKFPTYRETLARSAQHFAEASVLLDDLARLDAPDLFPDQSREGEDSELRLEVSRLKSLSLLRAKNLLRFYLHAQGAPIPQTSQLHDMLRQLCGARNDASVCIAYGSGWQVRRYRDEVFVLRALNKFERNLVFSWSGEAELAWPALDSILHFKSAKKNQGASISLEKLQCGQVTLRLRSGGETLRPNPKAAKRTLKNLLQEQHVPPWQRERLPLLYCGDDLVCVPNVAIAAEYQADSQEAAIFLQVGGP